MVEASGCQVVGGSGGVLGRMVVWEGMCGAAAMSRVASCGCLWWSVESLRMACAWEAAAQVHTAETRPRGARLRGVPVQCHVALEHVATRPQARDAPTCTR